MRRAQVLLTTHSEYNDLSPTQYQSALTWLREMKLLDNLNTAVPSANRVLEALFERAAPAWVRDADKLVQSPDELPTDVLAAGSALGLDADSVYEQLVASWGKVDTATRERVGAAGEAALVSRLQEVGGATVDHVAKRSDGFGYDVTFSHGELTAHLEVKSTTRASRFVAYLSRNEYNVMLRDSRWVLVTVRLTADLEIDGVGSVPRDWIAANAPSDDGPFGSWQSVKLEVPPHEVVDGIPRLAHCTAGLLPNW